MPTTPEDHSRKTIDRLLKQAGWALFDRDNADINSHLGTIIRQYPLTSGIADYMIYVDGKCAGIIEAKQAGTPLLGVETQAERYIHGVPSKTSAWCNPLPFYYLSNSNETYFYNGFLPTPQKYSVFAFHTPDALLRLLQAGKDKSFLTLATNMPPLATESLWPAQIRAIKNLESSLAKGHRRALIQMATGSGKTYTAVNFIYRFIKYANVRRILFLVDRTNLGEQTEKEIQAFSPPQSNYKFHQEYITDRLTSSVIPSDSSRVCISTIQRLYAMLCGRELESEDEEQGGDRSAIDTRKTVQYNTNIPIDFFDMIITDECHRSIYHQWAQVLEYFDARIIGMTATPSKMTFGFFQSNLVMEYSHEQAVADNVNVPFDIYRIRTTVSEEGGKIEAEHIVPTQHRQTREYLWKTLEEDFSYTAENLDHSVVVPAQIHKVLETFKNSISKIFPERKVMPKTVIFAKNDDHAENIIKTIREVFIEESPDFARKITYTCDNPKDLITQFRTSYYPRIAVTVDMIATGTDIKPVEIVFFMRMVKSRLSFEQMKGRGSRVILPDDLQSVTHENVTKDRFIVVDAVGVCEQEKIDSQPMERKPNISFDELLESVAFGNTDSDDLSSLAVRFTRLHNKLNAKSREELAKKGVCLPDVAHQLLESIAPDNHVLLAKQQRQERGERGEPNENEILQAGETMRQKAAQIVQKHAVRQAIKQAQQKSAIIIDIYTTDSVIEEYMDESRAHNIINNFQQYIKDNQDEILALQILFARRKTTRLEIANLEDLEDKLAAPPTLLNPKTVWAAFMTLKQPSQKKSTVRQLTDLISLVRYADNQEGELHHFAVRVERNFADWLAKKVATGREFNENQHAWLNDICTHIAGSLSLKKEDLDLSPFSQNGGLGQAHKVFGDDLDSIIADLNEKLVA